MAERPFSLHVSDLEIDTLRKKLELTRLPDELEESAWDYGVPLEDIRRLLARWKDGFDWRAYEVAVNKLPQFTRDIDVEDFGALNIHYVHQRSEVEGAIPLLLIHGWPGHFMEVHKLLHFLVSPTSGQPSFHVVVPSLPGYGFSEAPKKKGFAGAQYAEFHGVFTLSFPPAPSLNIGSSQVARKLGLFYGQKHVKAWHTSFIAVTKPPSFTTNPLLYLQHLLTPYTTRDRDGLARSTWFRTKSTGYMAEQSTQPQTLGYSHADSPIGLLAWVYEKLVQWTGSYPWTDDEGIVT
ncbi:hypothetical protein NLI96_g8234 [Meripilus lineatus]|uniref:Epoxide hydrolase N-terminal domain-containing protein n=1 Tax=Meripilus lineatus TaxID=2056292 RepID=A0AAD5YC74_9APHY|nr:hypothetical protein NLI96_g8234 [Physisporinus lineatus]